MNRLLFLLSVGLVVALPLSSASAQISIDKLEVTAPAVIAGQVPIASASFGPALIGVGPISQEVVLVTDTGGASVTDACDPLTPESAAAINGKVALIDRGLCTFTTKALVAQAAGAVAVIVANNVDGDAVFTMTGTDPSLVIPSVMISQNQGVLFTANLPGVEVTLSATDVAITGPTPCVDGSAAGFPCEGVDAKANLGLASFASPNAAPPSAANDIWGWTDTASGREFALVGLTDGTAFVEVTAPEAPVYLGKLPTATSASSWRDIKTYADHAFIVSEASGHGMQVFDLTRLLDVLSPPVMFRPTRTTPGSAARTTL